MKIGLDLDGTLDDFWNPYLEKFGEPKTNSEVTKNVHRKLQTDKDFWLNLPVIHRINFEPTLYCTKRTIPKNWSKQWLEENNFPNKPLYQMLYQHGNKADMIKGRVDIFIDDSISNFIKMNLSGVPCLLIDSHDNQHMPPILKVYSLDIEEIKDVYDLALKTEVFKDFKKIFNEIK